MNTGFTLQGMDIPFYNQYPEKLASCTIHQTVEEVQKNPLCYDRKDITGALWSLIVNAQGVLKGISNDGTGAGEKNKASVKRQIGELAADLRKVVDVMKTTFETPEGKKRWGEEDLLNVHEKMEITQSKTPEDLLNLAIQMEEKAAMIED